MKQYEPKSRNLKKKNQKKFKKLENNELSPPHSQNTHASTQKLFFTRQKTQLEATKPLRYRSKPI